MSDNETILQYVRSIDDRTARMEIAQTATMQNHQKDDDKKHESVDERVKSLENSRLAARVGLASIALGGAGGAVKMGAIEKLLSFFS